jgi:hypothetical protein
MIALDLANWPQPLNWLYSNVLGNIVASAILGVGIWWGVLRKEFHKIHEHNARVREHLGMKDD